MVFVMKRVQEIVRNCDNHLVVIEQWDFGWRSEWGRSGVRNEKYRKVVMKTTGCSEWKEHDVPEYTEVYSLWRWCEVTC
jgi:hypothetical protein